jgi:hypothetical protein
MGASLPVLLGGTAHAATAFSEGWENGTAGWTVTGSSASQQCFGTSPAPRGGACVLRVAPTSSAYVVAAADVSVDIANGAVVSYYFAADQLSGDTDAYAKVFFDSGSVTVVMTDGVAPNNGVRLLSSTGSETGAFDQWPDALAWNGFRLEVDPGADTARLTIDTGSTPTGGTVSIPGSASRITRIELMANRWSASGGAVHLDDVTITTPDGAGNDTVTTLANRIPVARYNAAVATGGTQAYLFGGVDGSGVVSRSIVRFDYATQAATTLTGPGQALETERECSAAATIGGYAYVFGGRRGATYLNEIVKVNLTSGVATALAVPGSAAIATLGAIGLVAGVVGLVGPAADALDACRMNGTFGDLRCRAAMLNAGIDAALVLVQLRLAGRLKPGALLTAVDDLLGEGLDWFREQRPLQWGPCRWAFVA